MKPAQSTRHRTTGDVGVEMPRDKASKIIELVPPVIDDYDEYPRLDAITPEHLKSVKKYAERAHEATRLIDGDDEETPEEREQLRDEYHALVNYASSRAYANAGAMMQPIAYDQWHGVQFSDNVRMISHAIVHGYYRALWSGDQGAYGKMQGLLRWCTRLGIRTDEKTLRLIVNNGIKEGMFESGVKIGNNKTYRPTTKFLDMYQASCCLYAFLLGTRWLGIHGEASDLKMSEIDGNLEKLIEINPHGTFQDVAVVTRGVIRQFKIDGIDFSKINKPLPRISLEQILAHG